MGAPDEVYGEVKLRLTGMARARAAEMNTRKLRNSHKFLLSASIASIAFCGVAQAQLATGTGATADPNGGTAYGDNSSGGYYGTAVGNSAQANGVGSTASGSGADAAGGNSAAYGNNSGAAGDNSSAYGSYSSATGNYSTAIGFQSTTDGVGSTAMGSGATAQLDGATALGANSTASGAHSVATGEYSTASGAYSAATGYGSTVSGASSVAIGDQSSASADSSVAIGQFSDASRGAVSNYTAPFLSAPQSSVGEVSVGSEGAERQITNVAAGVAPTDAVNVAQLEGATTSLSNRIDGLDSEVGDAKRLAVAAGAIGIASSQIRYDERPGKLSAGVGVGGFHGQGAFAMGVGYTAPTQVWRANASVSGAGQEWGVGAGVTFTLN